MISESITLKTSNDETTTILHAAQGENGAREYFVQIKDSQGKTVNLDGCTAYFYVEKTDGKTVMIDGEIENDIVHFTLTLQACTVPGDNQCWIQIIKPNVFDLRVNNLTLRVKKCNFDGAIESTDEFTDLTDAIVEIRTLAEEMEQVKQESIEINNDLIEKRDSGFFNGADGPQGPQGIQGPKGDKGDKGDKGESGLTAPSDGFFTIFVAENGDLTVATAGDTPPPPLSIRDGQLIYTIEED